MSWRGTVGSNVNDIVDLGGIAARYVAIEILSNGGDANRVGLAEIAVTAQVIPGGNDYADWIGMFTGLGGLTAIDDDPDGDGNGNGVENFFGTDPGAYTAGLLAGVQSGNTFTFTHPQGTLADDLSAAYRWSRDLDIFNADGASDGTNTVTFSAAPDTPTPGTTTVTVTVTVGPVPPELFVDVEVSRP